MPDEAVRGTDASQECYSLLPIAALRSYAKAMHEGIAKYGRDNWIKADENSKGFQATELADHCIRHIYLWLDGDTSEDHLSHAIWNLGTLIHFMATNPKMDDRPRYRHRERRVSRVGIIDSDPMTFTGTNNPQVANVSTPERPTQICSTDEFTGEKVFRQIDSTKKPCAARTVEHDIPSNFTDMECMAYDWLARQCIQGAEVNFTTKKVTRGENTWDGLCEFARYLGWKH